MLVFVSKFFVYNFLCRSVRSTDEAGKESVFARTLCISHGIIIILLLLLRDY